jgi:solute:Na+ symporter, SSS family
MSALTLVFLLLYLAGVLAIGFVWRRRAGRDEESYFVADRSLNTFWGFLGLSSLTTGGSTTIALAALVATHGISGLWLDLSGALGLFALGLFLARRIRREKAVTLPEIIGRYYGGGARLSAALLVLVSEIVWFALLVEATQTVLTAVFGLSPILAIVGSTAVFVLYTSLGGQFAVARTDLLQYGLMVVGIPGIALGFALARGRFSGLPREVWSFPTSPTFRAGDIAAFLLLVGLPHLVGSDVYSKLLSCRDEATARRSALLASLSKVVFGLSVAAIALAARQALPPAGTETLPRAILAFVPPPLSALVLVALVATMQTSADIVLLSATAVTVRDALPAVLHRRVPLGVARALSPLYGALGLVVALALDRNILETLKLGYSIFAAGLILPVLAALLGGRFAPTPRGAISAMFAGGAVAALGRFRPELLAGRDPVIAGTGINLIVLLASSLAVALGRGGRVGAGSREFSGRSRERRPGS